MDEIKRITLDPDICHGRPTVRGLRYTVEMLLDLLNAGMSTQEILDDFEDLEAEDILAVLAFTPGCVRAGGPPALPAGRR